MPVAGTRNPAKQEFFQYQLRVRVAMPKLLYRSLYLLLADQQLCQVYLLGTDLQMLLQIRIVQPFRS